jgi:ribosomal protein S18 acetylase RimI-like enzyme
MHLRLIQSGDGPLLKDVTLRSVEAAPYAFGGIETLAEERARTDDEWAQLAAECAGLVDAWRERCAAFVIMDDEVPADGGREIVVCCAKALVFLLPRESGVAQVNAVWVDRRYRRRGLGRWLMREACAWAAARAARRLVLWVDEPNTGGAEFYARLGFTPTGRRRPVRAGASVYEAAFEIDLPAALGV